MDGKTFQMIESEGLEKWAVRDQRATSHKGVQAETGTACYDTKTGRR